MERVAVLREQERELHRAAVRTRQHFQWQAELQRKLYEGLQLLQLQRFILAKTVIKEYR